MGHRGQQEGAPRAEDQAWGPSNRRHISTVRDVLRGRTRVAAGQLVQQLVQQLVLLALLLERAEEVGLLDQSRSGRECGRLRRRLCTTRRRFAPPGTGPPRPFLPAERGLGDLRPALRTACNQCASG